jgi:DNA-binding NarL/FixJ family response regulator
VSTTEPVRVVLADDVADIRDLMRMLLERSGFEVVGEAADGDEAVTTARRTQPDLVVLDLAMPSMDGLQALPRIREEAPDAKIVVLSGFQADQMSDEARRSGAHAYVEKGTSASDILAVLRDVVGGGRPRLPASLPPPEEEVMSALVHELSTPITAIEGFAELLERMLSAESLWWFGQTSPPSRPMLPYTLVASTVLSRRSPPLANQLPMIFSVRPLFSPQP